MYSFSCFFFQLNGSGMDQLQILSQATFLVCFLSEAIAGETFEHSFSFWRTQEPSRCTGTTPRHHTCSTKSSASPFLFALFAHILSMIQLINKTQNDNRQKVNFFLFLGMTDYACTRLGGVCALRYKGCAGRFHTEPECLSPFDACCIPPTLPPEEVGTFSETSRNAKKCFSNPSTFDSCKFLLFKTPVCVIFSSLGSKTEVETLLRLFVRYI